MQNLAKVERCDIEKEDVDKIPKPQML